jgi:hypothetical protein
MLTDCGEQVASAYGDQPMVQKGVQARRHHGPASDIDGDHTSAQLRGSQGQGAASCAEVQHIRPGANVLSLKSRHQ